MLNESDAERKRRAAANEMRRSPLKAATVQSEGKRPSVLKTSAKVECVHLANTWQICQLCVFVLPAVCDRFLFKLYMALRQKHAAAAAAATV